MMIEKLMIGDWVYWYGSPHEIDINDFEEAHNYINPLVHIYEPIPITSEILEKNGFKLGTNGWECETEGYDILIVLEESHNYIDVTTPFCGYDCERIQEPLYVHKVQHILRDCNIYKEIII